MVALDGSPLIASSPRSWRTAHTHPKGWSRFVLAPWGCMLALRNRTGGLFLQCRDPFAMWGVISFNARPVPNTLPDE